MLYTNDEPPKSVTAPQYEILREWFTAWPEARPELMDFWARGGYAQRILWRRQSKSPAVSIGVRYMDEIETAIRRLALLDLDVDIVWCGDTAKPGLVVAPLDIDYEGVGGWGYNAASGDGLENRGGREWCPAIALASLLPDTITDWLATDAADFFYSGRLMVCPAESIAIPRRDTTGTSEHPSFAGTTQIRALRKHVDLLFSIDLPVLDGMKLKDVHRLCRDHGDELARYRNAVTSLIAGGTDQRPMSDKDIAAEIQDALDELRSSDKSKGFRTSLTVAGGSLVSAQLLFAVNSSTDFSTLGLAVAGAALAAAKWLNEKYCAEKEKRRNPYWLLWKLQGQQSSRLRFNPSRLQHGLSLPQCGKPREDVPRHWMAPPTGGWVTPTAFIPQTE